MNIVRSNISPVSFLAKNSKSKTPKIFFLKVLWKLCYDETSRVVSCIKEKLFFSYQHSHSVQIESPFTSLSPVSSVHTIVLTVCPVPNISALMFWFWCSGSSDLSSSIAFFGFRLFFLFRYFLPWTAKMLTVHIHVMNNRIPPQTAVNETMFKLKMIFLFALSSVFLLFATIDMKQIINNVREECWVSLTFFMFCML